MTEKLNLMRAIRALVKDGHGKSRYAASLRRQLHELKQQKHTAEPTTQPTTTGAETMTTATENVRLTSTCSDVITAEIVKGESIRLHGWRPIGRRADNKTKYRNIDATFRIGDQAQHGAYNLSYFGEILKITAKTVTIQDHDKTRRLKLDQFAHHNFGWTLEAAKKRNGEWMD